MNISVYLTSNNFHYLELTEDNLGKHWLATPLLAQGICCAEDTLVAALALNFEHNCEQQKYTLVLVS